MFSSIIYALTSDHPRNIAKKSNDSVPHSWIAIARLFALFGYHVRVKETIVSQV